MEWHDTKEGFREHLKKLGEPWEPLCQIVLARLHEATKGGTQDALVSLEDLISNHLRQS